MNYKYSDRKYKYKQMGTNSDFKWKHMINKRADFVAVSANLCCPASGDEIAIKNGLDGPV